MREILNPKRPTNEVLNKQHRTHRTHRIQNTEMNSICMREDDARGWMDGWSAFRILGYVYANAIEGKRERVKESECECKCASERANDEYSERYVLLWN